MTWDEKKHLRFCVSGFFVLCLFAAAVLVCVCFAVWFFRLQFRAGCCFRVRLQGLFVSSALEITPFFLTFVCLFLLCICLILFHSERRSVSSYAIIYTHNTNLTPILYLESRIGMTSSLYARMCGFSTRKSPPPPSAACSWAQATIALFWNLV